MLTTLSWIIIFEDSTIPLEVNRDPLESHQSQFEKPREQGFLCKFRNPYFISIERKWIPSVLLNLHLLILSIPLLNVAIYLWIYIHSVPIGRIFISETFYPLFLLRFKHIKIKISYVPYKTIILPVLNLNEVELEPKIKVVWEEVLNGIFGPNRNELRRGWKK